MTVEAVTCTKCGGPLPAAAVAHSGVVTCPFCESTMAVSNRALDAANAKAMGVRRLAVGKAVTLAYEEKRSLYEALREALKTHLERNDADAIARATFALAHEFDHAHRGNQRNDPGVIARLALDLMWAATDMPPDGREIDLPFGITEKRTITPAVYAELSTREPTYVPPPEPVVEAPTPKKKLWGLF